MARASAARGGRRQSLAFATGLFANREQLVFGADVQRIVGGHDGAVHAAAHVDFGDRFFVFLAELKHGHFAIFVADVDVAVSDQRTAPALGQHVIGEVHDGVAVFGSFGVQAMKDAGEVGDVKHVVLDSDRATTAMHLFFEIDFAIAILVRHAVVPNDGRVRIVDRDFVVLGHDRLDPLGCQGNPVGTFDLHGQLWADVTAFGRIDAPQVPFPFAVLGVLADSDVNQAVVDRRCRNQIVASPFPTEYPLRFFRVAVELPEQLGFAIFSAIRLEAVQPAIATGEERLRHATEFGDRRTGPLSVQNVLARRSIRPEDFAGVFVQADKTGCRRSGQVNVRFIQSIAGVDEQQIAVGGYRARAHVVLADAERLLHHVENPDDVGVPFVGGGQGFEDRQPWAGNFKGQRALGAAHVARQLPRFFGCGGFDRHITFNRVATIAEQLRQAGGDFAFVQSGNRFGISFIAFFQIGNTSDFVLDRAVIFIVVKAFGIQAANFATTGHKPQAFAFDQRRTANPL